RDLHFRGGLINGHVGSYGGLTGNDGNLGLGRWDYGLRLDWRRWGRLVACRGQVINLPYILAVLRNRFARKDRKVLLLDLRDLHSFRQVLRLVRFAQFYGGRIPARFHGRVRQSVLGFGEPSSLTTAAARAAAAPVPS